MDGERYFQITNTHLMPEFFMSLVGSSDHWMFISSLGALTAGRCDPDLALFPYAADDQISAARATTGPYTSIRIHRDGETFSDADHWEPFHRATPRNAVSQNLYKTALGNKLILEEIHHGLGLTFRYRWTYSEKFGFVRSSELINHNDQDIRRFAQGRAYDVSQFKNTNLIRAKLRYRFSGLIHPTASRRVP